MKWFRIHHEARTDAKLEALTDAQHRVWFRLMCFASEQPERGEMIGYEDEYLAVMVARGDVELLNETLDRLVLLRIIERTEDGVSFIQWKKRQYDKESDTPEETRRRKQEQRERDKASLKEEEDISHADVTPVSRPVTRPEDRGQRTDSETDTDTTPDGVVEAATAHAREAAEILMAAAWIGDEEAGVLKGVGRSFELVPLFDPSEAALEAEKFVRWHSGAGRKKRNPPNDWYKAWLNWIKKAIGDRPPSPRNGNDAYDPTAIWLEWAENPDEQDDVWQRNGSVIDVATPEKRRIK